MRTLTICAQRKGISGRSAGRRTHTRRVTVLKIRKSVKTCVSGHAPHPTFVAAHPNYMLKAFRCWESWDGRPQRRDRTCVRAYRHRSREYPQRITQRTVAQFQIKTCGRGREAAASLGRRALHARGIDRRGTSTRPTACQLYRISPGSISKPLRPPRETGNTLASSIPVPAQRTQK